MRGAIAAGMTAALERLELRHAFDCVYGSSAGAMMGAYFITGQSLLAPAIYEEDLPNRTFISFRRAFRRRTPIMDIDFLVDEVIGRRKPFDYRQALASPIELHVLATRISDGAPLDLSGFQEPGQLREALRAAARIPGLGGPPVMLPDGPCVDSGLHDSLGFRAALAGGATHVLLLRTRAGGSGIERLGRWQRALLRSQGASKLAVELISRRPEQYAADLRLASERQHAAKPPFAYSILPASAAVTIGRIGRNAQQIRACAEAGDRAALAAFGIPKR